MLDGKFNSIKPNMTKIRSALGLTGLLFVFMAVFFANEKTISEMDQSSLGVAPGSVSGVNRDPDSVPSVDNAWQKKLATHLAEMRDVPSGKSARHPNAIEQFLFGELKGYYLMELKDNKVREMMLRQKEAEDVPHYLGEELVFLEKNKEMWWIGFDSLSVKERNLGKSTVNLLDKSHQVIGEASFAWDSEGRLLSLKIEKN